MSGKQVRAQYTQEYKLEAVRQVTAEQAIAVVAKVLGLPGVVARLGKPVLAAQRLDRQPGIGLTQDANDLLLGESPLHRSNSSQG